MGVVGAGALRDRLALARSRDLTLGTLLERFATIRPNHLLAREHEGGRVTYARAADVVARAASALAAQIAPGDRVLVAGPNGYGVFLGCLAACRAGGVAVPVNDRMAPDEIAYVVDDAAATARVDDVWSLAERAEPGPSAATDPRTTAALMYTSGTTGWPKGAELTHAALLGSPGSGALVPEGLVTRGCVSGMPMSHVAGLSLSLSLAALGVPLHLVTHFRPLDALDAIEQQRPFMFVGVPAMYRMMLEAGAARRDLSSVHLWASGADFLGDDIATTFQRLGTALTLPGTRRSIGRAAFVDGYGMVELGGGVAFRVFPPFRLPGRGLLRAMRGYRLRAVDDAGRDVPRGEVGEIVVRGPSLMLGYHGRSAASAEVLTPDGWLRTGDLARARRFGFFELAGRSKDVIKHGGFSVFAAEVERALEEHPDIAEVAVIGVPDQRKGEVPVAAVRAVRGASIDTRAVQAFVSARLSDYKLPRRVVVLDELPRTGTDKVDKRRLRATIESRPADSTS